MNKLQKILLMLMIFVSSSSRITYAHDDHLVKANILAISVAFDAQQTLWRVQEKNGLLWVDASRDLGKSFNSPVQVSDTKQKIEMEGEARPKIAIGPEGNIYLTWTQALKKPFTGYIWFARSINGGKSFEKPMIVHSDRAEITHRFDALNVAANGKITVTWVDKRDLITANLAKKPYDGAAIYYAVSSNQGASFATEQKLADSSCECCRIALSNKPDGTVVAMWRHVFAGSERDHMMAEIPTTPNQKPVLKRVTFGHWKIDGCPHHGAALTSGGEAKDWWGYHMAWFDGGNDNQEASLFYARMDGQAWVSSTPKKFGNPKNQAGHPALLSLGEKVWLVWREIENNNHAILGIYSDDGGRSWSETKVLVASMGKTDYPALLANAKQPYLAWNTEKDGLILLGL